MTIDVTGDYAQDRVLVNGSDCGNLSVPERAEITLAALAQNEVAGVVRIPAYSLVLGLLYVHAALGANTALQFGQESVDGEVSDPDAFHVVADASAAGNGCAVFEPVWVEKDTFITVKNTGTGAATGKVSARALYIYKGI